MYVFVPFDFKLHGHWAVNRLQIAERNERVMVILILTLLRMNTLAATPSQHQISFIYKHEN